jgi:A/G-specific adenine glycosylase
MARFPTLSSLATAPASDVQLHWAGLGYYRRARFLHTAAQHIEEGLGGEMPRTSESLLSIPGIGPYTAGAIASIAFDECTPVVDGNVIRVLSRLRAIQASPKDAAAVRLHWHLAGVLVEGEVAGEWNQAVMELGATVCTPKSPRCEDCPVRAACRAYEEVRTKRRPCTAPLTRPRSRRVEVEVDDDDGEAAADVPCHSTVHSRSSKRPRSMDGSSMKASSTDVCGLCQPRTQSVIPLHLHRCR